MRANEYRTGFFYSHPGSDWTDGLPYGPTGVEWHRTPAETRRYADQLCALGNVVTEVTR